MIITSWNVNSVRARIENIKEYLIKFAPDIVMMQEIKTQDETFPYDDFSSLDYECHVFGQKSYNGVAIISKKKLEKCTKAKKLLKEVVEDGTSFSNKASSLLNELSAS